jgi:hypothetical protein
MKGIIFNLLEQFIAEKLAEEESDTNTSLTLSRL